MKEGGVYQAINKINGKRYIGSAVNLRLRWSSHRSILRRNKHCNIHLQRAWNLYGGKAFVFAVLEYVPDPEKLVEREQHYIDTLQPEYNIALVAGSPMSGRTHTEETKAGMSEAHTGRMFTAEHKENIRRAKMGHTVSEEARQKMSEVKMGHTLSREARQKLSLAGKGRVHSAETKAKIGEAHRGERGSLAKLSDQDVVEIKALLQESVLLQREIAARYGVDRSAISCINTGRTWSHISGAEGEVKAA